jgi:tetratricopeptide (TPR) repeat protein
VYEKRPDEPLRRRLADWLEAASMAGDPLALVEVAIALANAGCRWAAMDIIHDALGLGPAAPEVHAAIARAFRLCGAADTAHRHEQLLIRYARVADHTDELDALADKALGARDVHGLVDVASRHARQDRLIPALEACFDALRLAPADPDVHLQMARIRLALGWRRLAIDDLDRLTRLLELTGDLAGRERVSLFVATELGAR